MLAKEVSFVLQNSLSPDRTAEALRTSIEVGSKQVEFAVALGDITEVVADAIVCPSNDTLEYVGFGGVQMAIFAAAGRYTYQEAEQNAREAIDSGIVEVNEDGSLGLPVGFASATNPGELSRFHKIIHVNSSYPPSISIEDQDVVRKCISSALIEADRVGIKSLATPALGTGVYLVPLSRSIAGTILGFKDYVEVVEDPVVKKLTLVLYVEATLDNARSLQDILQKDVFPKIGD